MKGSMMTRPRGVQRPISLRQRSAAVALGMTVAMSAATARPQQAEPDEVELDTLRIEDKAADVNPYTQKGAPYKARVSGDDHQARQQRDVLCRLGDGGRHQ